MLEYSNSKSIGRQRMRVFLLIFRWLAVFLGLGLTKFGFADPINRLPTLLGDMQFLIVFILLLYHLIASMVAFKFDNNNLNRGLLIFMDAAAGGFMSYFFGIPYFFAAVLLPTLLATFYFDILISVVVFLFCSIFYGGSFLVPLIRNLKAEPNADILVKNVIETLSNYLVSSIALFFVFLWALQNEDDFEIDVKKFQDEKRMLFENHQATKKEFSSVFTELEKKQEIIDAMEASVEKAQGEKSEVMETLENTRRNLEKMRMAYAEAEDRLKASSQAIDEIKSKELMQLKEEFERQLDELQDEAEQEIADREEIIEEKEEIIRQMQARVVSTEGEATGQLANMQEKIALMVTKINQLNSALQAREQLFEAYSKINQNIDLGETIMAIVNESVKLVPSQSALLFLKDTTGQTDAFYAEAAATPYQSLFVDYSVMPGDGIVGWVIQNNKSIRIDEGEVRTSNGQAYTTLLTYEKSAIVMPIAYEKEVLGVMYLGAADAAVYSDKELYLMNSFCKLAGPTIHSAVSYEKAGNVSLTDEETGLFNETYFNARLIEEVTRSHRYEIPLTVAMIEIHNLHLFTEKNDRHLKDRLIKDLADILSEHIRETDITARLEENKFAVLLIHHGKTEASQVVERVRMSADMRSFGTTQAKLSDLKLNICLASLSIDGDDPETLLTHLNQSIENGLGFRGRNTAFLPNLDELGF